jgi:hypothetical protein
VSKTEYSQTLGFVLSNLVVPPFRFVVTIFGETLGARSLSSYFSFSVAFSYAVSCGN